MSPFRPSLLRALAPLFAVALCSAPARADDDPMAPYRARFKAGMERYAAGDLPKAIDAWEAIYVELGPEKAYRVAFDLGRAYDRAGDAVHAAERFAAFLEGVAQRRTAGKSIEPVVAKEEAEARARLEQIAPSLGRLHVTSETAVTSTARVDGQSPRPLPFTAYVAPGEHAVSFSASDAGERSVKVTVAAGAVLDVTPPPPPTVPPPPAPTPPPVTATPATPAASEPMPAPPPPLHQSEHPFSPMVLFVAGGATGIAAAVTTVWYAQALSTKASYEGAASDPARQSSLRDVYDGQRPTAYAALGTTIGLAAVTTALVAWYVAGTHAVTVTPTLVATPNGAGAGVVGRF